DRCPERYVFVENEGCLVCDACHHQLLDSTEELHARMYVLKSETENVNAALLRNRAFFHFSSELVDLRKDITHYRDLSTGPEFQAMQEQLAERDESLQTMASRLERLFKDWQGIYDDLQPNNKTAGELQTLHDRVKDITRRTNDYAQLLDNRISNDIPIMEAEAANHKIAAEEIARTVQGLRLDLSSETTLANSLPQILKDKDLRPFIELIDKVNAMSTSTSELRRILSTAEEVRKRADSDIGDVQKIIDDLAEENKIKSLIVEAVLKKNITADILRRYTGSDKEAKRMIDEINTDLRPKLIDLTEKVPIEESRLRAAQGQLMASHRDLVNVVDQAIRHEQELGRDVDETRQLFNTGTEDSSRHVEAANSYKDMSENVASSAEAVEKASEGLRTLKIDDMTKKVNAAINTSKNMKYDADKQVSDVEEAKLGLRRVLDLLSEIEATHREHKGIINNSNGTLDRSALPAFKELPQIVQDAEAARAMTQKFNDLLKNGSGEAGSIVSDLKAIQDADRHLAETEALLRTNDPSRKISNIRAQIDSFNKTQSRIAMNLSKLKEKILVTRGIADSIPVGVELSGRPDSRIKYVKANALRDIKAWMDVSMFVNTSAPDGALLYIGPDPSNGIRRRRQVDESPDESNENHIGEYVLVKLEDYRVCLELAVDNTDVQLFKNQRPLQPNAIYLIKVERTGMRVEISVRSSDDERQHTETKKLTGMSFVLDIEPTDPIYIGYAPRETGVIPLRGQISNVVINNVRIGQWEYRERGSSKPDGCIPQPTKNTFKTMQTTTDQSSRHFNGNGYLVLNKTYLHKFSRKMSVKLSIKTHAPEGLLFSYHNNYIQRYIVIQIRNGRAELIFDLGDHTKGNFSVNQLVNTGNETEIMLYVSHDIIRLQVDTGKSSNSNNYTVSEKGIRRAETKMLDSLSRVFNIGGVPLSEQLTYDGVLTTPFEGCVNALEISEHKITLSESVSSLGTTEGCRQDVVRKLSLAADGGDQHRFLRLDHFAEVANATTISFRFNTKEKRGLVFFARHGDPIDTMLTIALWDGTLVVYTKPGDAFVAGLMLNLADGRWHYVLIHLRPNRIQVVVDDQVPISRGRAKTGEWRVSPPFFFGGLSDEVAEKVHLGANYVRTQFSGCIADFTVNDVVVNFDDGWRNGVTLSSCNAVTADETATPDDTAELDTRCRLRYGPALHYEQFVANSAAYRFGALPHTRGEVQIDSRGKIRDETIVELEFRIGPYFSDGTLFLAMTANPSGNFDYVIIHLVQGAIRATFDLKSGAITATIPSRIYNDGKYHKLQFERRRWNAALIVDGQRSDNVQDTERSGHLDNVNTLFVGGMPASHVALFVKKFPHERESFTSFPGCIKDVTVNGERVMFSDTIDRVLPCSSEVEDGAFFNYAKGKRSWLRLHDRVISGSTRISMNIKARRETSILFFAQHTKKDNHIALFMVNGTITVQVKHAGYISKVDHVKKTLTNICDGEWHRIDIALQRLAVGLEVDGRDFDSIPTYRFTLLPPDLTNGPIYIGGLPKGIRNLALATTSSYGGCIKDLRIDEEENFSPEKGVLPKINFAHASRDIKGEVFLSTCYTT
ncbi:laminin protein epi-1-like, partial [Tropilaelaps mercedesae]